MTTKIIRPAFIGAEGIIAVGKSTLAKRLAKTLGFALINELDDKTNPYLGPFYEEVIEGDAVRRAGAEFHRKLIALEAENKNGVSADNVVRLFQETYDQMPHKEIAIKMQWFLLVHRYLQHFSANLRLLSHEEGSIIDRTIYGDTVFVRMLVKSGRISQFDADLTYFKAFDTMLLNLTSPDLIIFLDITPENALKRCIKMRGRDVESKLNVEYLRALQEEYEHMLRRLAGTIKILRIDWNCDRDIANGDINDVIGAIKKALPEKVVGS